MMEAIVPAGQVRDVEQVAQHCVNTETSVSVDIRMRANMRRPWAHINNNLRTRIHTYS